MWRRVVYAWCVMQMALVSQMALVAHSAQASEFLLPADVQPVHYDLRLTYDLDPITNFTYFGVVDILIKATNPTSKIILHGQDFTVSNKDVKVSGLQPVEVTDVKLDDTYNFLIITLDKKLDPESNYTLTVPFSGNLKHGLDGVYISNYVNKKTKAKEYLIATQFEAISARKGFPCFDEPMFKATFRITIGHSRQFSAVSNMPLKLSTDQNVMESHWPWYYMAQRFKKEKSEFTWDVFEDSVPMSTYLVAFLVSKFSYVDSPPALSTTKFRIWARSDAIDQTKYASVIGPRVLSYFEKFFNVSFPLPKQDMVAIPDFSAGAMENWGLITYRETALLYDPEQSSFLNKERVAEVIAHELAHQWFGNLVTMKWWSDLWLNEGFATFVGSLGVAAVEPEWRSDRNHAVSSIMSVLNLDALESSHPVSVPIEDPKRIQEIFDEISYSKGATLIRMMTMFLGEEVFRSALHNYLQKYSYQNAEQDDLWRELTIAARSQKKTPSLLPANGGVKQIMDTWTTRTGYPLLTVTRDYQDNSLTITQKRYLALSARSSTTASWWVPLSVLCEPEATPDGEGGERGLGSGGLQWLSEEEGVSSPHRFEHGSKPNEWVLFNYDMIGLYRVNYDKRNWQLLTNALGSDNYKSIPVLGRVQLLSDAFALAWTNRLPYETALKLSAYLSREKEYLPLSTGLNALHKIDNVLKRSPEYGAFQKFIRKLIGKTYEEVGGLATKKILNGDNLDSVRMQALTSHWACRSKVPGCEESAIQLFEDWMNIGDPDTSNPIPLELRPAVYCVAVSRGGVREWRFVLSRLQRANVAAARDRLLAALSCSRDPWVLAQYLEWAISDGSVVRRQDTGSVINAVTRSQVGYYIAKDFIYNRIQDIHTAFKGQDRRLGQIIKGLLDQFTHQRELDEFLEWREKNAKYLEGSKLAVKQAVEKAAVNIEWVARNKKLVVDKFRELAASDDDMDLLKRLKSSADCPHGSLALTSHWACRSKVPGCEESAIQLFEDWMNIGDPDTSNPIPLELRPAVYCVAVSRGGVREWRFVLSRLQRANVAAARDRLLAALSCSRDPWVLAQYLEWAISDGSVVRRQDTGSVINAVTRSQVGYYIAKDFIYNRIQDIHTAFKGQDRRLGQIIKGLLDQFTHQRELDEFLEWREKNAKYLEGSKLAVKQAVEKAAVNIEWVARNKKLVVDKFRELAA